jgi:hypothetical protein
MKSAMKSSKVSATTMARFLFACILFLCAATAALAQAGRGSISGLVSDPTGAIVPGAKVTLLNHATGVELHTVTTAAGLYIFVSLNPGVYQVTASMKGFESVAQDNVNVTVDQTSTVNIALRVGSVTDTVTVTAGVDLVDSSNSTVGTLIGAETIDRVPLLTRNVYDLVQLSAGVAPVNGTPNSSTSQTIINISSGRPGIDVSSYTINGSLQGSVYYMLDGSPLGVTENNMAAIMPAMEIAEDGVEEARVETQNTPASYQSGGAGVISLVSKSGGNQFHGDAFLVMRPDVLAANAWSNKQYQLEYGEKNEPNGFHRYQEGGAISGPILRKKLFFFFDYEQTQQALYDGSNRTTVPTAAERTGDFSADSFTIYDPTSPDSSTCTFPAANSTGGITNVCPRQAFSGNKILNPNPVALKFLSEFPLPNATPWDFWNTNNRFDPGVDPLHEKKFDIRIDWNQGEKERLFGRFTFDRIFQGTVNTSHPPSGAFDSTPMWDTNYAQNVSNGRNILIADDYNLNSTTVLQMRYSFTRHFEVQGGDPAQTGYDITKLGFPAELKAEQLHDTTLPMITFNGGSSSIGGTCCWNTFIEANEAHDANATVTKVWGKHELSFGGEFMKRLLNGFQPPNPAGDYDFAGSATSEQDQTVASDSNGPLVSAQVVGGNAFASFLTGLSDYGDFTQDLSVAEASPYYAAFAEDTYHPTKTFTVTLGLRWDIFGGKTERHNRLEYWDPNATDTVSGVSFTGAEVYNNSSNRSPFTTNMTNFSPRLGFSWQPVNHLVVRGGGGFYYGPSVQMPSGASEDSDGFSNTSNTNPSCLNADNNVVFNGWPTCIYDNTSNPGGVGNYTGPNSISNPFPTGLIPIISNPTGLGNNLGTGLSTMLHSQRTQVAYNFNFGVEYEFPGAVVFSAAYVGSRGLYLPLNNLNVNTLDVATVEEYQGELCGFSESNCVMVPNIWKPIEPSTNYWSGQSTVPLGVSLMKYPQFASVGVNGYPGGDSDYSSLQMKLQKRLTAHFTTLVAFTWAKLMTDDAGSATLAFIGNHNGTIQDAMNLNLEHSVSSQDEKYNLTGNLSYDLPIGKGRAVNLSGLANEALGGWTVGGIVFLSTGNPIPSLASGQYGTYFSQRANLTCDPGKNAPHKVSQWFTASCFAVPSTPYIPGNSSTYLDHLRQMGATDLDMMISKKFPLGKGKNLRIDINGYNVTNQAQYGMPNLSDVTSINNGSDPTFGQITYTVNNPRQFQGAARFTF